METKNSLAILVGVAVFVMVLGVVTQSRAEISLCGDEFTMTGFLRYEFALHIAESNPNLEENHDINLSRAFFQTEWNYKPTDVFKVFAKARFTSDQTSQWDSHLDEYNAFPVDVPSSDWTMMRAGRGDNWRAEIWELYSDLSLGNLWLRLGKQQIAWGEMIGLRMMDAINSVDYSWHFMFEPEEFENIRIPNWMIRANYLITDTPQWISDVSVEGFFNPGDVVPNFYGEPGAPFRIMPNMGPSMKFEEEDRRGDQEYGVRFGGLLGSFYFTLNYLYVYNDDAAMNFQGFEQGPAGMVIKIKNQYPVTDIYGFSCNYAIGGKINTVVTVEAKWVPNLPYMDAKEYLPEIKDQGTFSYAINLSRPTFLMLGRLPSANVALQFAQIIVEGDEDRVFIGQQKVDKVQTIVGGMIMQNLMHNDVTVAIQPLYDTDGAYMFKPSFKYTYGDYWYFDLYAIFCGGSEDRPGRFGSLGWADEVVSRITFQF